MADCMGNNRVSVLWEQGATVFWRADEWQSTCGCWELANVHAIGVCARVHGWVYVTAKNLILEERTEFSLLACFDGHR